MKPYSVFLAVIYVACIGVGVWGAQQRPTAAAAQAAVPTPGQLEIVGKNGRPAGLCPLKHTSVNADISGYVARVTVTQQFTNPSTSPVEAVYTFPLPDDAAVDDMTMTIGRRIVKGEIRKKEEARMVYESAKAQGKAAALLDQERPNIFTQSVANIMPGDRVDITISYVNLLKYQEGSYEFVFPMVVGPRYVPGGGYTTPGVRGDPSPQTTVSGDPGATAVVTDAHKITPPITPQGTRAGHDISITVNLDAGLPLQSVNSTLHQVSVNPIGRTRALVKLKDQATIPNKDFILKFAAAGSQIQSGVLTYAAPKDGQIADAGPRLAGLENRKSAIENSVAGYFTLIVQPPAAPPQADIAPKEMVFVIDQTGSQSGWPIAKAKEVMQYCIKQMNPNDTFQLLAFNTEVYPCFDKPVPNNAANVDKAIKFLAPLEGNGGTDILKAVDYALNIPDDPNRLRIVCYLTDGYVGNDMQIIDYVKKHRGRARMFPFGIGNSVNRFLIEGMAKEGRGASDYVTIEVNTGAVFGTARELTGKAKADAANAAERFYHRIASPVLLDPQIDWNGLPVEDVYPKAIPDVFSSGPVIVKGRYTHAGSGDIIIRGILRGQPWSQTVHVDLPPIDQHGEAIKTLWAREKIEDLQSQDWLGAQTGNPVPNIRQQIESVALEYHLMSQYTSFVAVEQTVVNVGGKQRTVDVPVEMPEGVSYDNIFGERAEGLVRQQARLGRAAGGRGFGIANGHSASLYMLGAGAAPANQPAAGGLSAGYGGFAPATGKPAAAKELKESEQLAEAKPKMPALGTVLGKKDADKKAAVAFGDEIRDGLADRESYRKQLSSMKPADRAALMRKSKLSPELQKVMERYLKLGASSFDYVAEGHGYRGELEVQIWVNNLKPEQLAKLKALMLKVDATLIPGKLVMGRIKLDKVDAILALPFVGLVEFPKYK